jgi:hypothetical protein
VRWSDDSDEWAIILSACFSSSPSRFIDSVPEKLHTVYTYSSSLQHDFQHPWIATKSVTQSPAAAQNRKDSSKGPNRFVRHTQHRAGLGWAEAEKREEYKSVIISATVAGRLWHLYLLIKPQHDLTKRPKPHLPFSLILRPTCHPPQSRRNRLKMPRPHARVWSTVGNILPKQAQAYEIHSPCRSTRISRIADSGWRMDRQA